MVPFDESVKVIDEVMFVVFGFLYKFVGFVSDFVFKFADTDDSVCESP